MNKLVAMLFVAGVVGLLAACSGGGGGEPMSAAMRPIPKEALDLMAKKAMSPEKPILVRIFKEESELEIWKQRDDGRYYHFKSYPICNWSGDLGPKVKQGDKQAPEGFYSIAPGQLNPHSQYHLAFNIGFPNSYDRAWGRTGEFLMVHGDCRSAGCYAMTDALVEEIYAIGREALKGGQEKFDVHAFPFRMTDENMKRHAKNPWMPFWKTLKEGYDHFELTRQPPAIAVCDKHYLVNAKFSPDAGPVQADAACPTFHKAKPDLFVAKPDQKIVLDERILAPGKKTRNLLAEATSGQGGAASGASGSSGGRSTGYAQSYWGLGSSGSGSSRAPISLGFGQ